MSGDQERLIKELTATRVKLDGVAEQLKELMNKLETDHDMLLNHESRITYLERWVRQHEKSHHYFSNLRYTAGILILAGLFGAFFSWLFTFISTHIR